LGESEEDLKKHVMSMFTDPEHLRVSDPGKIEGNTVFEYLDAFDQDVKKVQELKDYYQRGGLGDVVLKKYLFENGIQTEIHYPVSPNKQEGYISIFENDNFLISEEIHRTTLSLPISYSNTVDEIQYVIDVINRYFH
jgi:tryptophanyl-tRNA synthetase